MYAPPACAKTDRNLLIPALSQIRFACVVFTDAGGICANHLPMLVDESDSENLVLLAHAARANDIWRRAGSGVEAIAIFQGPNAYIHPGWYPSKEVAGRAVPTWDYIVVHAHGTLEAIDDTAFVRDVADRLSAAMERGFADPWSSADAPAEYIDGLIPRIVGLRLRVKKLEGSWKIDQNKSISDRIGLAGKLDGSPCPHHGALSRAIKESLPSNEQPGAER